FRWLRRGPSSGRLASLPSVAVPRAGRHSVVAALRHRGRALCHCDSSYGVACRERHRETTPQGDQVRELSTTRRELEARLRSLLPDELQVGNSLTTSKPAVAALGDGGLMTGYVWGWIRG